MNCENRKRYEIYAEGFAQIPDLSKFVNKITYQVIDLSDYVPITKLGKNKSMEDLI